MVCHQLEFGDAVRAYSYNYFGSGNSSMPIWLDEVQCTTGDNSLSECNHNGWGIHDCYHSEDAGVACYGIGLLYYTINEFKCTSNCSWALNLLFFIVLFTTVYDNINLTSYNLFSIP